MRCVDALVAAVPNAKKQAFIEYTRQSAAIFKRHGALDVVWCWGTEVPDGDTTSFPLAVQCAEDETVVLGWVFWPSSEVRAHGMPRVFNEPKMQPNINGLPYDGARAIYGTFEPLPLEGEESSAAFLSAAPSAVSSAEPARGFSASVCGVEKRAVGTRT